jgi:hypothetical protein
VPKYFGLREASHSLSEAIPTVQDPAGFEIDDWITVQWRDGALEITGRLWANGRLGDRTEIEPHSDRDISWHEGAGFDEPRICETESLGRGAVTGQWRGLEITAADLARLLEYIQGLPESQNAPVTPAVPAEASNGPALASAHPPTVSPSVDDQPLQPEPQKRKPRRALKTVALIEWLDQQSEQTRQWTPTHLAGQYCKERPGICSGRWAFKVFSNPEKFRGRQ